MNRRTFLQTLPALSVLAGPALRAAASATNVAQDLQPIMLPKPEKDGGKSVMAALWERKTNRNISPDKLPMQTLSNLLWAAFGVNREHEPYGGPGRTAASAGNSQEIDLYVALPEGVYLYEAVPHRLAPIASGDLRAKSGKQAAAAAPLNIFYVVDLAKYIKSPFKEQAQKDSDVVKSFYYVATGLIAGNVYLFAASQGLAAQFHTADTTNTPKQFKLRPEQRVLYAHTVGYPAPAQPTP